jgi:type VI secretion system secreted protein VgrG
VSDSPNRFIVVAGAALAAGGIAMAIAASLPGRATQSVAAPSPAEIVQTPQPVLTPEPTPTPAPSPTPAPQTYTISRRSAPASVAQPQPRSQPSGGAVNCNGIPSASCKAISNQPGSPKQPSQPDRP